MCEVYAFMEIKLTSNAEIFSNYSNIMILNHENQTNIDKNEIKLFDDTRCQRTSFRDDYNYDADTELHVEGMIIVKSMKIKVHSFINYR